MRRTSEFDAVCPHCGRTNELHTDPIEGATPKSGDISICWECVGVSQYTETLDLQLIPQDEYPEILMDPEFQELIAFVRRSKIERMAQKKRTVFRDN